MQIPKFFLTGLRVISRWIFYCETTIHCHQNRNRHKSLRNYGFRGIRVTSTANIERLLFFYDANFKILMTSYENTCLINQASNRYKLYCKIIIQPGRNRNCRKSFRYYGQRNICIRRTFKRFLFFYDADFETRVV